MKTHFKKLRNPNFLGSWDLMDDDGKITNRILTISDVKKEMVFDGKGGNDEVVVLHFQEAKPMIMNSTNLSTISKVLGSVFIEDWVAKQIELTAKKIKAFGEFHDALRIVASKVAPKPVDLTKLNNCKNLEDLKTAWETLTSEEKLHPEMVTLKNKLKNDFTK